MRPQQQRRLENQDHVLVDPTDSVWQEFWTNGLSTSSTTVQMIERLQSVADQLQVCSRRHYVPYFLKFHGLHILLLSRLLWQWKDSDQPTDNSYRQTGMLLILSNLQQLYQSTFREKLEEDTVTEAFPVIAHAADCLATELEELSTLPLELLERLSSRVCVSSTHVSSTEMFKVLLRVAHTTHQHARLTKQILTNLVAKVGCDWMVRQHAQIALVAWHTSHWPNVTANEHTLFLLECRLECQLGAGRSLDTEVVESLLNPLLVIAMGRQDNISAQAASCLSMIAGAISLTDQALVARSLYQVFLGCSNVQVRQNLISGLSAVDCLSSICLQDRDGVQRIISCLVQVILRESSSFRVSEMKQQERMQTQSTQILLRILSAVMPTTTIPARDLVNIINILSEHDNDRVAEAATRFLCKQTAHVVECPDMLTSLALAIERLGNGVTEVVLTTFLSLSQSRDSQLKSILVRQPHVVGSILAASSTHPLALEILLNLSDNLLDRRVMARQSGLLPSLIRFTRTHGDGSMREQIKERILSLAAVL